MAAVVRHSALLGRERDLAQLRAALDDAAGGDGRLVLVVGEAGIGKTRLAEELATHARERGHAVHWAHCHELPGAPAFFPWAQLLREIAPEMGEFLSEAPAEVELDPPAARFRLFDRIASLLRARAGRVPLVIVLDDLHWADRPSLALLQFVARELAGARILIVGTYRDAELEPEDPAARLLARLASESSARSLPLRGLGEEDVGRWIESVDRHPASPRVAALIQRGTAGNPFLVGQVVDWLAAEGRLRSAGEELPQLPRGMREVVARRVERLPDDTREILVLASAIGVEFDLGLLECVAPVERGKLLERLAPALDARLLRAFTSVGRFGFAHALVRDALHDGLSPLARIALHRRVAEAYEERYARELDAHLPALAHHWLAAAGAGDSRRAADYCVRAARHAAQRGAWEEAALHYRNAVGVLSAEPCDPRERFELTLAQGDAELLAGDHAVARVTLRDAMAQAHALSDASALARVAISAGKGWTWGAGAGIDDPELRGWLDEARRALGTAAPRLRSLVLSRLAVARFWSGSPELAAGAVEVADLAITSANEASDERAELVARAARHWVDSVWRDRDALFARGEAFLALAERCGDTGMTLLAHAFRVVDLLETGDVPGVERHADAYTRLAEELRHPANLWFARGFRAQRAILRGEFAAAESALLEAAELARRARSALAPGVLGAAWFGLRLAQGRLADVEALVRAALGGIRDPARAFAWRAALAYVVGEQGRDAEARALLDELAQGDFAGLPQDADRRIALGLLARVCRRVGDPARAAAVRRLLLPVADRHAVTAFGLYCAGSLAGPLGLAEAALGNLDAAIEALERALERDRALGSDPLASTAAIELAEVLVERSAPGDRARALELASEAAAVARRLGTSATLDRAERIRSASGAAASASAPDALHAELRLEGEYWTFGFGGRELRLRDLVGVRHLARLLAEPGRELLALDLAQSASGTPRRGAASDTGPLVDPTARRAYQERLARLRDELDDAEKLGDHARAERASAELDALAGHLAAALGLGGRARRAGADSERARLAVTQRIKDVVGRLGQLDPTLGRHLSLHVRTGHYCVYRPDPDRPVHWRVSAPGDA